MILTKAFLIKPDCGYNPKEPMAMTMITNDYDLERSTCCLKLFSALFYYIFFAKQRDRHIFQGKYHSRLLCVVFLSYQRVLLLSTSFAARAPSNNLFVKYFPNVSPCHYQIMGLFPPRQFWKPFEAKTGFLKLGVPRPGSPGLGTHAQGSPGQGSSPTSRG